MSCETDKNVGLLLFESKKFALGDRSIDDLSPKFLDYLTPRSIKSIRSFYQDSEGNDKRRKVNDGFYLRHILRTMVNTDLLYQQLRNKGQLPEGFDYEVLIWASALHDAVEISRENGGELDQEKLRQKLIDYGIDETKAENIAKLVLFLTPEKTDEGKKTVEQKRQDFDRIWSGEGLSSEQKAWRESNQFYLRLIKAADVLANLYETVDELEKGKVDGQIKRPLAQRYLEFQYRIKRIEETFGPQERVRKDLEGLDSHLPVLADFLSIFKNQELSELIEIKYVLSGNNLLIAQANFYNHDKMSPNGDCGGVVIVDLDNYLITFVRGASSIKPDDDGIFFWQFLSEPSKEGKKIKVLKINFNNIFAGLT